MLRRHLTREITITHGEAVETIAPPPKVQDQSSLPPQQGDRQAMVVFLPAPSFLVILLMTFPPDLLSGEVLVSTQCSWTWLHPGPSTGLTQARHFRTPTSLCSLQILHSHRGRFWPGEASIPHLVQTFYERERERTHERQYFGHGARAVGPKGSSGTS